MDNETRSERLRQFLEKRRKQDTNAEPGGSMALEPRRMGGRGGMGGGGLGRWSRERGGGMGGGMGLGGRFREQGGGWGGGAEDDIIPATPAQIAKEKQRLRIREGWLEKQLAITRKRLEDVEALEAYALESGILDEGSADDADTKSPGTR